MGHIVSVRNLVELEPRQGGKGVERLVDVDATVVALNIAAHGILVGVSLHTRLRVAEGEAIAEQTVVIDTSRLLVADVVLQATALERHVGRC